MIELADTSPGVDVQPAEYSRLLGYPRGWVLEGRARELADWAREWYAGNGRPWIYARQAQGLEIADACVRVDGASFTAGPLRETLRQADAHGVILAAVSAGPEVEQEAGKLWREEKPDEYFFLEAFGSAVVEHLTTMAGARLCAWADGRKMAVLPHYSPGYAGWDIGEQPRLLALMKQAHAMPGGIEVLDSGALRPRKSLLALFGLTRHAEGLRRLTELVPCRSCSFSPCQFRRAPYLRETACTVNPQALKRWAEERLSLAPCGDGSIDALFRFDGTTCTNMGRPLAFHYQVKVGPREEGYPIREQRCTPAPGDAGHTFMCRYIDNPVLLMAAIEREKPLAGQPLSHVLGWQRPASGAGCQCELASREHTWGLVLETIYYALIQGENREYRR